MNNNYSRRRLLAIIAVFAFLILVAAGLYTLLANHSEQSAAKQQLDKQQAALAASPYADPILKYLPYGDLGYDINSTQKSINGKNTLVLVVSITLTGADYRLNPQQLQSVINDRKQSALAYIRSKGFDPAKYHIEYIVPAH